MAFPLGQALYTLLIDDSRFNAGLQKAMGSTKQFGVVAGAVAGAGVGLLTNAIGAMAAEAAEEEVGIKRLSSALSAVGQDYDKLSGSIERKIAAQTRSYAFADDAQRDSLARLVLVTRDTNEAFKMQAIAMDLARARGISLVTATDLLIQIAAGRYRSLAKLGIAIEDNMTKEQALAKVQEAVAGQAQAYGEGTKALGDRMAIAWGNVRESIGGALGPMASVAVLFNNLGLKSVLATASLGGLSRVFVTTTKSVGLFGLALRLTPIGMVITGVTLLGVALKILYDKFEGVRNAAAGLGNLLRAIVPGFGFVADMAGQLGQAMGLTGADAEAMGDDFIAAKDKGVTAMRTLGQSITEMGKLLDPPGADRTRKLLEAMGADEATINLAIDTLADEVGGTMLSKLQKRSDKVYAELTESAEKTILGPIRETLDRVTQMSAEDFAKLAATKGKTAQQYMDQIKAELTDAERRFEHFSKVVGGAVKEARAGTMLDPDEIRRRSISPHIRDIHDIRDAWMETRDAAAEYQRLLGIELENIRRPTRGGGNGDMIQANAGPSGAVAVTMNLNYAGGSDGSVAAAMAGDVLDTVTESLRQQLRRVA